MKYMNIDTFYTFEHKYLNNNYVLRKTPFCVCKHIILDIVLVVQLLVFVYFRFIGVKSGRQTNGIYSLT